MLTILQRIKIEGADPLETVIDPEGDLRLVVGPDEHSIIVSSKILCVASAVFKEKLAVFKVPLEAGSHYISRRDGNTYVDFSFPVQVWKSR